MSVVLGGVTLNKSMVWVERYKSDKVAQSVRMTLEGRPIVFTAGILGGQPVTLEGTQEYGWLKKEVVDQVLELAEQQGGVFTLTYGDDSFSVMFDHANPPAVDMTPFVPRVADENTDYFYGQIRLIKV